jgi:response regulator of citrate/malate metabolism
MPDGLDIIIVDDDPSVAKLTSIAVKKFYTWGKVFVFTDIEEAISYSCVSQRRQWILLSGHRRKKISYRS